MTDYSYAQLESLWIGAGGPKALAPEAAAIAEAESGGNSDSLNPNDNGGRQSSFGLWQISNGTHAPPSPNWANPAVNAQLAVAKWKAAGDSFSPWGTFSSGAYKAFLSSKTSPDPNVPGSPSALTAQTAASGSADCLVGNPLAISVPLIGSLSAGPSCLFSRSNARAFIGAGLVLAGGVMGLATLAFIAVAVGMKAAGPLGKAAEGVGGVMMLVPGAQPAGAAVAAGGKAVRNPAAEGRRRAAGRDRADRERLGEPKENPGLEVGGGTVREDTGDRAGRQRRQGAARSRARRSTGQGRPAPREETGF